MISVHSFSLSNRLALEGSLYRTQTLNRARNPHLVKMIKWTEPAKSYIFQSKTSENLQYAIMAQNTAVSPIFEVSGIESRFISSEFTGNED